MPRLGQKLGQHGIRSLQQGAGDGFGGFVAGARRGLCGLLGFCDWRCVAAEIRPLDG